MRNRCLFMSAIGLVACVDVVHSAAKEKAKEAPSAVTDEANEVPSVTLEEAIIATYNGNIGWLIGKIEKGIADDKLQEAKCGFLPDVSANMTLDRTRTEDDSFRDNPLHGRIPGPYGESPGKRERTEGKNTQTGFGVQIKQDLFNGFTTVNTMKAAEHASDAALHGLRVKEQELIEKVFEEYANVWFCRAKVSAHKKTEENVQKLLSSQNSCLEAGTVTPAEVADASAKYQNAIYNRIQAETELFSAESKFEKLTGLRAGKHIVLPEIKLDLPKTLETLVAETMKSNSKILHTRLNAQAAEKQHDAAKGELSPQVDLTLHAGRKLGKTGYRDHEHQSHNTYSASLEVKIPIFANGGRSYSKIAITGKEAQKARLEAENAVLEAKEGCVVNWNNYITANAMIRSSRSAVQSAELSNESNIEEVNFGTKSNTDIWQKENDLLKARINLAESKKTKVVSAIKLFALSGNLNMRSVLESIRSANPVANGKAAPNKQTPKK